MELDETFFSQYPESEALYYVKNCEPLDTSVFIVQQNQLGKLSVLKHLKSREVGECFAIDADLQLGALKRIIKSRWSSTIDNFTILGDCVRLLGRRLTRWEGRAVLHLFENGFKEKAPANLRLEPLPRWIIPFKSFVALLNLLTLCGMDLKCRNSKKLNLLTDLLRHCDEEPIRQQDFMELLSCMMQRGFHVRTPKNYILLEFFIALRSPDFKEEISPITVAIVKMLLEAQDAKAKKNEEAMSLRQAKRHSACFDPYVLFLEQFKKNPNRSGTEVLRLFLDNGYFNKKKALCYVFSFKTYKACFHSMEKLESILIASRLLRKRVSKVNKCSDATDDCFWTIPNTFYSPSAKPISSILDFVGCISKLHFSCVFEPQPLRYALFATCKKCVEKTLPDIIRAICARDSSIITFTEMRLRDNALLLLSYNPLRRHRATYEAVSVLIEFGIDVGYVNYVGYNGLIMFLINDDSSESCCEYGNWLEPKDYSYWDTLTLLVGAGCKIDLCKKFGKGMLYKALSKLSFNSVCAKCARGKLIDASSRRECFDHFSKFFAQLLTFGLNFDADTKCDTMNIALHACESYKGDEKTALKKLVSKLDVTSNIKCDDS